MLGVQKIEPSDWYLEQLGVTTPGVGNDVRRDGPGSDRLWHDGAVVQGVVARPRVRTGAPRLRGRARGFWATMLYLYLCLWSYYTIRASSFYFVYVLVYRFRSDDALRDGRDRSDPPRRALVVGPRSSLSGAQTDVRNRRAGLRSGNVEERILVSMGSSMCHRGPDDEGEWRSADARVARSPAVAVIDLSPGGRQPMTARPARSRWSSTARSTTISSPQRAGLAGPRVPHRERYRGDARGVPRVGRRLPDAAERDVRLRAVDARSRQLLLATRSAPARSRCSTAYTAGRCRSPPRSRRCLADPALSQRS